MLKKFPFIKQIESKDCAIACIQMIFKYYNGYINKLKLEEMTHTTRNGTTAYHIVETLKYYGFDSKGIRININKINTVTLPAIAHVTVNKTYNHYVVIYKIDRKHILIADPSSGIKKMRKEEFEKIYNGILIICSQVKTLPKYIGENNKSNFVKNILANYISLILKLLFFSFIIVFISIINSFYLKNIIENIGIRQNINFIFILYIYLYLSLNIFNFIRNKLLIYINQYIDYDITTTTFKQIISLPYRYYASKTTGDIITRIKEINILRETISKFILIIFVDLILITCSFIILYFINTKLFIIALVILLLYILILIIYKNTMKTNINLCQEKKSEITSYMVEAINNYENIKGLNIKNIIINKFNNKYFNYATQLFKTEAVYNNQMILKNLINDIGFVVIIYIGVLEVMNNSITLGALMTFNSLLVYFLNPIKEIIEMDNDLKNSINILDRILELYYEEKENGFIDETIKGKIKISNLSFSYDNFKNSLTNLSFDIEKGNKVLILGKSGSGKSTILKLLKRYYQTDRNKILIDDIDICDYKIDRINEDITYISQNESLYTDTLYNNIDLNRNIASTKIDEIVKLCNINFIDNKLGYNMLIEENGFNLSGGQRQRIILARSLLKKFKILLIDEATNQIDAKTERKILKNIFNKYSDKTIIVVSHRTANMDLFNKVINLNRKNIKEVLIGWIIYYFLMKKI